ncbi:MAG: prepilin-type N-terminal cleavage/methylation domain-containing protein [Phycisphaeraceae bacterium]|nr:prepilin-type N-terminal cleavage/methylation domain-containing protein [Phycisphaeraceae bacterium]
MRHPSQSRRGFTIVELLVVIGIIALLIGILIPALGLFQRTARHMACQSNLTNIVQAVNLYLRDHEDVFPVVPNGPMALLGDGPGRPLNDTRYLADWIEIARSPSDLGGMGGASPVHERLGTSYWYSSREPGQIGSPGFFEQNGVWLLAGHRKTQVSHPGSKVVVASPTLQRGLYGDTSSRSTHWYGSSGSTVTAQVGYVDGSVGAVERKNEGPDSSTPINQDRVNALSSTRYH